MRALGGKETRVNEETSARDLFCDELHEVGEDDKVRAHPEAHHDLQNRLPVTPCCAAVESSTGRHHVDESACRERVCRRHHAHIRKECGRFGA
eukprot:701558-Rhodomonas_salina.1